MFENYERLPILLELQRRALATNDQEELGSLSIQIDQLSREITGKPPKFDDLDTATRRRLRSLIKQAQTEVDRNMEIWQQELSRMREAGENLQATRRYFRQFQQAEKTGHRYSKRG